LLSESESPPLCCGMPEVADDELVVVDCAGALLEVVLELLLLPPPQPATTIAIATAARLADSPSRAFLSRVLISNPFVSWRGLCPDRRPFALISSSLFAGKIRIVAGVVGRATHSQEPP
jgi:hypothetical protein